MVLASSVSRRPDPLGELEERATVFRESLKDPDAQAVFDKALHSIDRARYSKMQAQYAPVIRSRERLGQYKYLDVAFFLAAHARKASRIGLLTGEPRRVLDVGSGGGHLLAICKAYGHEPIGLDVPNAFYQEMCDLYGVRRLDDGVHFGVPFPSATGKRKIILATALNFDYHRSGEGRRRWSVQEWAAFLKYVTAHHLDYPGLLHLEVNPGDNVVGNRQSHPLEALFKLCESVGAVVDGRSFRFDLDAPLVFDGVESAWT